MNKKTSPRFTGQPEMWFNKKTNVVVIRSNKYHCEVLKMDQDKPSFWNFIPFKEAFTFDFYNGSKHLVKQGFKLITRL